MNSDAEPCRVPLRQIDFSDFTFRITTREDTADIRPSIARIGLLHPPVLQPLPSGYRVICGFRRIRAASQLALDPLPAMTLPVDSEGLDRARRAVADNSTQRPLNLIEQSRALTLLAEHLPEDRTLRREAAALGLPSSPDLIGKLLRLGRLGIPIQEGVRNERLSLAMALELEAYPEEVAAGLAALFDTLRLGLNRQRELLTLLREIAARESRSLNDLLADPSIRPFRDPDTGGVPGAAGRLLDALRRRRFPTIARRAETLRKAAAALDPGPGIRLEVPTDFESPTWRLTLAFQRLDQLHRRLQRARDLSRDPRLQKILAED